MDSSLGSVFSGCSRASEEAYSAALYIRLSKDDVVNTHLVAAKAKVAPIKTVFLPRLEICGAVLVSDLVDSVVPHLGIDNCTLYFWLDSTIVLSWLRNFLCNWTAFVANRESKQKVGHTCDTHYYP